MLLTVFLTDEGLLMLVVVHFLKDYFYVAGFELLIRGNAADIIYDG